MLVETISCRYVHLGYPFKLHLQFDGHVLKFAGFLG